MPLPFQRATLHAVPRVFRRFASQTHSVHEKGYGAWTLPAAPMVEILRSAKLPIRLKPRVEVAAVLATLVREIDRNYGSWRLKRARGVADLTLADSAAVDRAKQLAKAATRLTRALATIDTRSLNDLLFVVGIDPWNDLPRIQHDLRALELLNELAQLNKRKARTVTHFIHNDVAAAFETLYERPPSRKQNGPFSRFCKALFGAMGYVIASDTITSAIKPDKHKRAIEVPGGEKGKVRPR